MKPAFWQIGNHVEQYQARAIQYASGFDVRVSTLGASLEIATSIVTLEDDEPGFRITYKANPLGGAVYGCLGATPDEDGDVLHHVSPGIIYYALARNPIVLALVEGLFRSLEEPNPLYPNVWELAHLGMNTDQVINNINIKVGEGIALALLNEKKNSQTKMPSYFIGAILFNYPNQIRETIN